MTDTQCPWCDKLVVRRAPRGPAPTYCSSSCRQRFYEARRNARAAQRLIDAWSADLDRVAAAVTVSPAFVELQETMRQAGRAALPRVEIRNLISDETLTAIAQAFDTSRVSAALAASPAFVELQETMRQAGRAALPRVEIPNLISDETLTAIAQAFDTSRVSAALAASPAFVELQETMRQAGRAALPRVEIPNLISDETLTAIAQAFDTSRVSAALAASPALLELADAFSQYLSVRADVPKLVSDSVRMQSILDELSFAWTALRIDNNADVEGATRPEPTTTTLEERDVALHAAVLFAVVLAVAVAAVPGTGEAVAGFGQDLLEGTVFIGKATYSTYEVLAEALPDDNLLGWAALFAWILRWLKGVHHDAT